ncbi:unnamed protein product [Rotaria socialis]|uniref:PDZ domain-containing protein n=1 Tax=Rotaria socialis TaxID=392032 RepID=A0A818H1U1_9BILA|nr:unnamed protein product [Rotaria socialis]CAF4138888.1 unnamed protein product [Rotaria socialis]
MKLIENKRDILVFFNEKNILKSPITLTNDHIKSEFIALRRHKKTISVGICRCSDQSLLTDTSIQHISSLTYDEFQKLSIDHSSTPSLNESRKSLTITDEIITTTTDLKAVSIKHKAIIEQHKPLIHKRSASPNRDSGFIETDGTNTSMLTDRSVISNSHTKHRSKASLEKSEDESTDTHKSLDSLQQSITKTTSEPIKKKPSGLIYSLQKRDKHVPNQTDLPVQTVTDACFIYRREVVKPDPNIVDENSAIVQRGREIAYEAANAPSIPPSMPNYSRDQIRELYGELDKKTRRLQEDEYTLHSPVSNSSNEKHQWKLASPKNAKKPISCPMPKFRLEKPADNDEALLMAAYLSTGITNPRMKPNIPIDSFHTVMMNASAKVNEWAHNNEIYLAPVSKSMISNNFHATTDNHSTINPTPLLFDVHFNIKQSAGTPTGNNSNRPTFLEIIEQESISNTNQPTDNNDENFRTLKRQSNTTDTISSSPDLNDIALETTPSTPGSCGMYLEPYMRRGYDLPCLDHNIRDSSWQHSDHDDGDEATLSLKTMTPIESPVSPKFDTNIDSMPPMTSNVVDSDSLVDLDDGTTVSYYSAKESRIDTTNHSTLSVGSDETISSLQQNPIRDDIINNFISPEDNYYFDALASPSHTNQQTSSSSSVTTSVDKQNLLIDNLANLLEEIETFNHTSHQLLSRVDEESSQLSHEEEESSNRIDRVITVVDNVHQYNQIESMDSMNNLLFVYDDIDVEQPDSSINNLVEIVHTIHQAPVVINNLLFVYDETVTPSDGESKTIINGSSEWSYDNLMNHQDETDNLGFVVHEALTSKLQKSPKYEETHGSEESMTDNLGFVVHEALTGKTQTPTKYEEIQGSEESMTDNLGFVVHEALTGKIKKSPKYEETHGSEESMVDNLGFVVHEALTGKTQTPTKYEEMRGSGEAMTDNLGFVVHEALTSKIQKSPKYEQTNKREESTADTDSLSTLVHTVLSSKLQKPTNPVIYETVEPIADNDNLITVVDEVLTTNFQKLMPVKSTAELDQSVPRETYSEFIDDSLFDTSIPEDLEKSTDGYNQESISFNDEQTDDTHTSEILTYEIEQPNQQSIAFPVINLSQIVSDTLLTGSNYHQYKNNFESNITRQPEYDEEIYEEYGYRRTTTDSSSNDIVDRHEELCRRYLSSCKQYQTTTEKLDNEIDQFEKHLIAQKPQLLSPTSDVTSEELITTIERIVDMRNESATNRNETDDYCSTITVQRQPDDYGKYGFDFEELFDGKIQISNILDENYCHNMNIGDEIISINNDRTFKTREECQQVFDSLWKSGYENIPITVIKSVHIPIVQGK